MPGLLRYWQPVNEEQHMIGEILSRNEISGWILRCRSAEQKAKATGPTGYKLWDSMMITAAWIQSGPFVVNPDAQHCSENSFSQDKNKSSGASSALGRRTNVEVEGLYHKI